MALDFKPITLDDREIITAYTLPSDYQNCDFAFANMCSWRFLYDSEYTVAEGFLLIRFKIEEKTRFAFMNPVGRGDLKRAIDLLEADSLSHGHPLCMLGVTPDFRQQLDRILPGEFVYLPERDYFDYIYLRQDLVELKGRKYQPKRNHINKFTEKYNFEYRTLTPELVPDCLELEAKWLHANSTPEDKADLSDERRSMIYALHHFDQLGLTGGALCVEGQIVAFTFGSPINHNTFGIHVEKADTGYDGAYPMINREFASRLPEQFVYVNREEDLGIPGLRQSKLSYHPVLLLEKGAAIKRKER